MPKSTRGGQRLRNRSKKPTYVYEPEKVDPNVGIPPKTLPLKGLTVSKNGVKSTKQTLQAWEARSKNFSHEEILLVDEKGNAVGYYRGISNYCKFGLEKGVIPANTVLTHNHPVTKDRSIGGTFSNDDLMSYISYGFKEGRASAVEGTYYFRAGKNADPKGFVNALNYSEKEITAAAEKIYRENKGKPKNKTFANDTYLKEAHKWLEITATKYGYEYGLEK